MTLILIVSGCASEPAPEPSPDPNASADTAGDEREAVAEERPGAAVEEEVEEEAEVSVTPSNRTMSSGEWASATADGSLTPLLLPADVRWDEVRCIPLDRTAPEGMARAITARPGGTSCTLYLEEASQLVWQHCETAPPVRASRTPATRCSAALVPLAEGTAFGGWIETE